MGRGFSYADASEVSGVDENISMMKLLLILGGLYVWGLSLWCAFCLGRLRQKRDVAWGKCVEEAEVLDVEEFDPNQTFTLRPTRWEYTSLN